MGGIRVEISRSLRTGLVKKKNRSKCSSRLRCQEATRASDLTLTVRLVASQSIPSWNRIITWLKGMETLGQMPT